MFELRRVYISCLIFTVYFPYSVSIAKNKVLIGCLVIGKEYQIPYSFPGICGILYTACSGYFDAVNCKADKTAGGYDGNSVSAYRPVAAQAVGAVWLTFVSLHITHTEVRAPPLDINE